ncbi:hypothetical protein BKA93DRAFT_802268 [Sparassis latifolia]
MSVDGQSFSNTSMFCFSGSTFMNTYSPQSISGNSSMRFHSFIPPWLSTIPLTTLVSQTTSYTRRNSFSRSICHIPRAQYTSVELVSPTFHTCAPQLAQDVP